MYNAAMNDTYLWIRDDLQAAKTILCDRNKVPMMTMMVEMIIVTVMMVMTKKITKKHTNSMTFE